MPDPVRIVSENLNGYFSVSWTTIVPNQTYTLSVPPGSYSRGLTFIGATGDTTGKGWLNLYVKNPNAAAPPESMLQLINRFRIGCGGECWAEHNMDFYITSETELVLQVGYLDQPASFLLKLFGRA